jgi:hypothetical protein
MASMNTKSEVSILHASASVFLLHITKVQVNLLMLEVRGHLVNSVQPERTRDAKATWPVTQNGFLVIRLLPPSISSRMTTAVIKVSSTVCPSTADGTPTWRCVPTDTVIMQVGWEQQPRYRADTCAHAVTRENFSSLNIWGHAAYWYCCWHKTSKMIN